MEIKQLKEKDNRFVNRKEYVFSLSFDAQTPTREDMRQMVISKIGANPKTTILEKVKQITGKKEVELIVYVYDSEDDVKRFEPTYMLKRNGLIKEEKKEGEGENE